MPIDLDTKLAERDTPAGRRYELRLILLDAAILSVGYFGLALVNQNIIAACALGHLAVGFLQGVDKIGWAISTALTTAAWVAAVVCGAFLLHWFAWDGLTTDYFMELARNSPATFAAYGVVLGGGVTQLFTGLGWAAELVEIKNQTDG